MAPDLNVLRVGNGGRSQLMGNALHATGVSIMTISIVGQISEYVIQSRHLTQPNWLSSFGRITPYSLWAGLLLVFTGIVVRDRSWGRRLPGSK